MKTVLLTCTFATFALSVIGAPAYTPSASEEEQVLRQYPEDYPYLREARSQFSPQYFSPCAAAAAASASSLHGYAAPYHLNVPSFGHYGYGAPNYRSVEPQMEPEMLAFSDMGQIPTRQGMMMDHVPMARNGYGAPISPISALGSGLGLNGPVLTAAGGSAYGIFPNANVGGCNVPLLFSCSPSISSGRLVEPEGHYSSGYSAGLRPEGHYSAGYSSGSRPIAAANSYRLVEDQPHHDVHEHSEEVFDHEEPVHEANHGLQAHS